MMNWTVPYNRLFKLLDRPGEPPYHSGPVFIRMAQQVDQNIPNYRQLLVHDDGERMCVRFLASINHMTLEYEGTQRCKAVIDEATANFRNRSAGIVVADGCRPEAVGHHLCVADCCRLK